MNPALLFALTVSVTISNAIPAPKLRSDLPSELSDTIGSELDSPSIHEDGIGLESIGPDFKRLNFDTLWKRSFDSDESRQAAPEVHGMDTLWKRSFDSDESRQAAPEVHGIDTLWKRSFDSDESRQAASEVHLMNASLMKGDGIEVAKRSIAFLVDDPSSITAPLVNDDMVQPDHPTKKVLAEEEAINTANKAPEVVMPLAELRYLLY